MPISDATISPYALSPPPSTTLTPTRLPGRVTPRVFAVAGTPSWKNETGTFTPSPLSHTSNSSPPPSVRLSAGTVNDDAMTPCLYARVLGGYFHGLVEHTTAPPLRTLTCRSPDARSPPTPATPAASPSAPDIASSVGSESCRTVRRSLLMSLCVSTSSLSMRSFIASASESTSSSCFFSSRSALSSALIWSPSAFVSRRNCIDRM